MIKITNPNTSLKELLVDRLTHTNPKFHDAQKMGYSTRGIDEFIRFFRFDGAGNMLVPRGIRSELIGLVNQLNLTSDFKDARNYKPFKEYVDGSAINFRPYQSPAINQLLSTGPEGVLVSPAGSGKTVMGLSLIPITQQSTIWLTHTDRLFKQCHERCQEFLPSIKPENIGLIGGGNWSVGNILTIAMIPTLVQNIDKVIEMQNEFGLLILDECLTAGTKILMLDGTERNIEDIKNGEITTFGKITNKFERKTDSVIKLRCSIDTLYGTKTHKLPYIPKATLKLGIENKYLPFKESDVIFSGMSEINKGDFLLTNEIAQHTEISSVGKERARLLALIACDGHINKQGTCLQVGVIKDKDWFMSEMWYNTLIYKNHNFTWSDCTRGDLIIRSYSKRAVADMLKYIPKGKKSRKISVPDIIKSGSYDDIKNYLQVVFDCEGSVTDQITLTMASHTYIKDIQFLLHKFGIVGRLMPIKRRNYMRLSMSGIDAFLFWKKIGFSMTRKQQDLTALMKETGTYRRLVKFRGIYYRCIPVIEKEVINEETTVYDFTTDQHLFIANGILSSNCHHCPATTFTKIITNLNTYFMYGLTATPFRRDKLESLMFQCIGPVGATVNKQDVALHKGMVPPTIVYCGLNFGPRVEIANVSTIFEEFIVDNDKRNARIKDDVVNEAKKGNFCIVASGRKKHCEILHKMISAEWPRTGIATGKYSKKHVDEQVAAFDNKEITVLVTTPELLGEGFDVDFLNRLFVTTSFRTEARAEQLIGRIQRFHPDKKDSLVYEYIDENIGVLKNQYFSRNGACRYNVYRRLGLHTIDYNDLPK